MAGAVAEAAGERTTRRKRGPRGQTALPAEEILQGGTPRTGPARNKAGRYRADEGLEDV